MARSAITGLLTLFAVGCLVAGLVVGFGGHGDTNLGITLALLCMAPCFAFLAMAMVLGLGGDDDA